MLRSQRRLWLLSKDAVLSEEFIVSKSREPVIAVLEVQNPISECARLLPPPPAAPGATAQRR
jgi:hypothetical protein